MKKTMLVIISVVLLAAAVTVFAVGDRSDEQDAVLHPAELRLNINHQGTAGKDPVWYVDNTMGVTGISLRDYDPSLTDKWYHVVPVDLSRNGKQSIYLVASYMYYIGTVTVEVQGDEVTTTYSVPDAQYEIYPGTECMKWFTSMEDITADFLADPTSDMQFGTPVSREKDLEGQSIALLFICNRVTYCNPLNSTGDCLYGYCESVDSVMNYQAECRNLLEKMNQERAAREAEEAAKEAGAEDEMTAVENGTENHLTETDEAQEEDGDPAETGEKQPETEEETTEEITGTEE